MHLQETAYISDLEAVMMLTAVQAEFGRGFLKVLSYLPVPALKNLPNIPLRLQRYGSESIERLRRMVLSGEMKDRPTFFSKILETGTEKTALTTKDIVYEAANFIVAGSDTTAITLTYLTWSILRHPEMRAKIEQELANLGPELSLEQLEKLTWLNMAIEETLRLYGAAPGALPRVVPQNGTIFQGHFIPQGTVVTTQSYSLHRNPTIFAEPSDWRPGRWLEPIQQMRDAFMPFGAGSRICLCIHLARAELLVGAAKLTTRLHQPYAQSLPRQGRSRSGH